MHVSLTEKLDEYVREKVASGLYNNASEVIREALRLKIAAEAADDVKLQRLRDAMDAGLQQAGRAEFANYSLKKSLSRLRSDK
ncbi:type II toxin-antitoxin system ParD family antitoxin [Mesorhizobium denitrificans]|uniref:Type II toxin-antitoxin system ParD family antitoxin n=1 Tax=Mesorhizobium denitrificans TaxID=2294114 RepID=A0A371XID1_9HYPH|nr:type II toxin-antitoxin system ParD family antitoxin [Mesorhizobium denitrificans]